MEDKIEGFKSYRHDDNPLEKKLHDMFSGKTRKEMSQIIFPPSEHNPYIPSEFLTDREMRIVLTTIQWIGSPVGQCFFRSAITKKDFMKMVPM